MTHTKLGRYPVADPPSALNRLHFHLGEQLKEVDHEPRIAVLDQEDLLAQGIRCSQFIPGAGDPDALGSCTANSVMEHFSTIFPERVFLSYLGASSFQDTVGVEKAAIRFYHACTDQTGSASTEWPPTDCGSSGPYLYKEARAQGLISTEAIAHGAQNIVSLMQRNGVIVGLPWLQAWFEPDAGGFVDGNGSLATLQQQIALGVAGGHEIHFSAIEKLAVTSTGRVIPEKTVIRFRNHWTRSWGDNGSGRFHLSTIVALGNQVDVRQFRRNQP
jgi:hypothetical protein